MTPILAGPKVIVTFTLALGANGMGNAIPLTLKLAASLPVIDTAMTVTDVVLTFVMTNCWEDGLPPTAASPKFNVTGARVKDVAPNADEVT